MTRCAHCGKAVEAGVEGAVHVATGAGSVTWCDNRCAVADGWPDDLTAPARILRRAAAESAEPTIGANESARDGVDWSRALAEGESSSAAGESPVPTAEVIPMSRTAGSARQELRIEIRVPLHGDLLDQAPALAAMKGALDGLRASLEGHEVEASISHEVVTPRPRKPRAEKAAA